MKSISKDKRHARPRSRAALTLGALLLLTRVASLSVAAQTRGVLSGTVCDQSGAVIAGASVSALNEASGQTVVVVTDASGRYELARLPSATYRISVSATGFEPVAKSVTLRAGSARTEDFSLAPVTIRDSVTITAAKGVARPASETPQVVTVADARDFELRRPASPLRAVEMTPNLSQVGSSASSERPRLRGLTSNRLLVVVDGDRLNNVRSDPLSGVSPSIFDVAQLQTVEVVSGAGSSLYGSDALAGTINLITKEPDTSAARRQRLGLRFDGDARANGALRRGASALNWTGSRAALRLGGSLFRVGNYRAGNRAITREEVARAGQFVNELGNAVGNNVARTYGVWELPARSEVPNAQAHGFNFQTDLRVFLPARQSIRFRQLNSQHKQLGFPFSAPPFDARNQSNTFRRLDKYGLRYEGHELATWLARLALSFYRQKYAFTDANFVSTIDAGSSWRLVTAPAGAALPVLTGDASTFTPGIFTDGKNSVTSYGLDAQATLAPRAGLLVTTGLGYLRDSSRDEFSRFDFSPQATGQRVLTGRASNPDAVYRNLGWFNLLEHDARRWLRLTGGFRLDNWKTRARVTRGFPLDTESAVLLASFPQLAARPGSINVAGLRGIVDVVNGARGISTSSTVLTGNFGVVVRAPGGVNPYFRWGTSYREPGITERYILRDFGDPTFSVLLAANTELRPERGRSYDLGVKVSRARWNASAGYFRNDLKDFLHPAFGDVLFIPADRARGLLPVSPVFPFHGVLYAQRVNTARARIEGFEAAGEMVVRLGRFGYLAPSTSAGWLKGSDLTPDPDALTLIESFYNRPDTPLPLRGSRTDAPLAGITPFRALFNLRYASAPHGWFVEYGLRGEGRVRRADPLELSSAITTQYGTLASLSPLTVQNARVGYERRGESRRLLWTLGLENLSNRFYFEHFQNAPAPGRSLVFGMTVELFDLLRQAPAARADGAGNSHY